MSLFHIIITIIVSSSSCGGGGSDGGVFETEFHCVGLAVLELTL